ncbi:hypothetical protein G3N59_05565 [Paraburkholderia sp. Ac-20340]|uniref:hypothetical protein n=1 Tax=Paraburkholderia sp. Ac-20340 TaxID=2703888 RepID=UPI00197E4793|nr:hypothetical protein [Paraburkholderia sp. Ac-20340]MBN3852843.1 hypothetical protein [Paraburkholderia sp. Ac-20340]
MMNKFVRAAFVAAIATGATLANATPVEGMTKEQTVQACRIIGDMFHAVAIDRDLGKSEPDEIESVKNAAAKNHSAKAFSDAVMTAVTTVYEDMDFASLNANQIRARAVTNCITNSQSN